MGGLQGVCGDEACATAGDPSDVAASGVAGTLMREHSSGLPPGTPLTVHAGTLLCEVGHCCAEVLALDQLSVVEGRMSAGQQIFVFGWMAGEPAEGTQTKLWRLPEAVIDPLPWQALQRP